MKECQEQQLTSEIAKKALQVVSAPSHAEQQGDRELPKGPKGRGIKVKDSNGAQPVEHVFANDFENEEPVTLGSFAKADEEGARALALSTTRSALSRGPALSS